MLVTVYLAEFFLPLHILLEMRSCNEPEEQKHILSCAQARWD